MTVYVTTITHKYGTNLYVNRTRKGATKAAADYCRTYWPSMRDDAPPPEDDAAVIKKYFDEMVDTGFGDGEYCETEACEVEA